MIDKSFIPIIQEIEQENIDDYKQELSTLSSCSWDSIIRTPEIEKWLSNFTGIVLDSKPAEQILALHLAISYVYFTENDVRSMSQNLWWKYCHFLIENFEEEGWENKTDSEKLEYIVSNTSINPLGNLAGSGTNICYYFRQANSLGGTVFRPYNSDEHKLFCVIDDATLSGKSAIEDLKRYSETINSSKAFYLSFITSNKAKATLNEIYPNLKVISALDLDDSSKLFNDISLYFYGKEKWKPVAKYLCKSYGEKLFSHNPLGYNNGQYAIGFFYNTPNNSLPIFWGERFGWNPLFKRYFTSKGNSVVANDEFFY